MRLFDELSCSLRPAAILTLHNTLGATLTICIAGSSFGNHSNGLLLFLSLLFHTSLLNFRKKKNPRELFLILIIFIETLNYLKFLETLVLFTSK